MRILSAEAMREVDRIAIEELGIPSMVLMENAAIGVVDAIGEIYEEAESAAIFCGPGNNGGDGLAIARHLAVRGYDVQVFLVAGRRGMRGDAEVQLGICRRQGLAIQEVADEDGVVEALEEAREADLIVDALFGTGLSKPLEGILADLVQGLNDLPVPRVSVDLPSGLNGSKAEPLGPHIEADLTVTFAAPKIAHVFPPASESVGELVVTDLGIPPELVEEAEEEGGALHLLVGEELSGLLPERKPGTHKGDYGHVLLVAGSPGKAGAAILAARAAVRSGAGLVTAAVPESILDVVDLGSIESMTLPLRSLDRVLEAIEGKSVLAMGPGLGQEDETVAAVRRIAGEVSLPLVLDADGINAFAGRAAELAGRSAETVLTPHPGELGRLLGISTSEVQGDRIAAARRAAVEAEAVVVLKGYRTLVATPGGEVHVNPTGNPGMATGGSGDVLTGLIAGLLAQGLGALDAARLGVYLHGLAGDLAAARTGEAALAAGDLLTYLPAAFLELEEGGQE
ncbi:MAG: ADP-dependent NAD(P)H-hydrate dehydratase / NAD(P)H-hydrate epimerase [Acidobacteriota bacterium]|jgi:NAD(P)H-hydrate epimerase|nr:ADP-dependent NAD(P)H-hydrate dehydratase / NAD(P)H-hydrate epimerase [Acidobacteriota bacterium]